MEKKTMTVKELAGQMGVSIPKAYELTCRRDFPCISLGRRKVIPIAAFEKWLEDAARQTTA